MVFDGRTQYSEGRGSCPDRQLKSQEQLLFSSFAHGDEKGGENYDEAEESDGAF